MAQCEAKIGAILNSMDLSAAGNRRAFLEGSITGRGISLSVSLREEDYIGPEAAIFVPISGDIMSLYLNSAHP